MNLWYDTFHQKWEWNVLKYNILWSKRSPSPLRIFAAPWLDIHIFSSVHWSSKLAESKDCWTTYAKQNHSKKKWEMLIPQWICFFHLVLIVRNGDVFLAARVAQWLQIWQLILHLKLVDTIGSVTSYLILWITPASFILSRWWLKRSVNSEFNRKAKA